MSIFFISHSPLPARTICGCYSEYSSVLLLDLYLKSLLCYSIYAHSGHWFSFSTKRNLFQAPFDFFTTVSFNEHCMKLWSILCVLDTRFYVGLYVWYCTWLVKAAITYNCPGDVQHDFCTFHVNNILMYESLECLLLNWLHILYCCCPHNWQLSG